MPAWLISIFEWFAQIFIQIFAKKVEDQISQDSTNATQDSQKAKDLAVLADKYKKSQGEEADNALKDLINRAHQS